MVISFGNRGEGELSPRGDDLFMVPREIESYNHLTRRGICELSDVLSKARKFGVNAHGLCSLDTANTPSALLKIAIPLVRDSSAARAAY